MKFKIYKIECLTTGKIYIGQTRNDIKKRINSHILGFNNGYKYCHSYDVLLNNNFTIEVIDEVDCVYVSKSSICRNGKYNYFLPNNLEAYYMNYFKSINGTNYLYGWDSKKVKEKLKEKRLNERKKVERIKYDYNNIKTNILNSEEIEEFKNKYLNNDECNNNVPPKIEYTIEYYLGRKIVYDDDYDECFEDFKFKFSLETDYIYSGVS